jgi:hypothetical protein
VQLGGSNYLNLAEVKVLGSSSVQVGTNLALNKPATQYSGAGYAAASKAVDGNTNGQFSAGSVTHTGFDAHPWWQVDLGASATINSVVIFNRTDCCGERLNDYWVFISDTPFLSTETLSDILARSGTWKSHQSTAPNPSSTISLAGVRGRYVRVQLSGSDYLHLAEVQVVGTIP